MATASTINIGSEGAMIQWTSTSDPNPPILTLQKGTESWISVSGNKITVSANSGAKRSCSVSATSTTTANTAYNGTATVTSGYTIEQSSGAASTKPLLFDFLVNSGGRENYYDFRVGIAEMEGYFTFNGVYNGAQTTIDIPSTATTISPYAEIISGTQAASVGLICGADHTVNKNATQGTKLQLDNIPYSYDVTITIQAAGT